MIDPIKKAKSILVRKKTDETPKSHLTQQEGGETQHKSKLMICIEVLCNLVSNGPMKLTRLREKLELHEDHLKPHLRLLWNRGLIEEENFGEDEIYYVVTERGIKVLKVVGPMIREAQKIQMRNFETITSTLSEAGYS